MSAHRRRLQRKAADSAAGGAPLHRLGAAMRLQQGGRLDDAESAYQSLLRDHPDDLTALVNAGVLAMSRADTATAVQRLAHAARLAPGNAVAHNNLGFALVHAGDAEAALHSLDQAVRLAPDYAQAHNNRGIALARLRRSHEAAAAFERALALDPARVEAAVNLGELHARAGQADAARAAFEAALAVEPGSIRARTGCALAAALAGDLDGARASLGSIVAQAPQDHDAWKNLGAITNWAWDHAGAERAFAAALARIPGDAEAAFGVASTLLARGRYLEGFAAFEQRPQGIASPLARFAEIPPWDGAKREGTLLLYAEQGLGDVVQFARYIAPARTRVARVVVLADGYWRPLAPLIATAPGVDRVAGSAGELAGEALAARASVLSLPHLLRVAAASSDAPPYLAASPAQRERWLQRLASVVAPRVGLAWSVHARDDYGFVTRHKSIPPALLASLLDTPAVQFVTVQPGPAGDPAAFGSRRDRIVDVRKDLRDFGDTAGLIAALDLVITPDTAVAHVAGALGVPVWMLDRYNCCWRWRAAATTSDWYPGMRIFRQARFGDWSGPAAKVAAELRSWRDARG